MNNKIRALHRTELFADNPLYEIVKRSEREPLDECEFVDRVSRSLREGRFLLLIVGDGVREELASLANYLLHHSLRYSFGIIQIRLFRMPNGDVLAMPDIMAKTETIERHVTVVTTQGPGMTVTEASPGFQVMTERVSRTSITLDSFFEWMGQVTPEDGQWLRSFVQSLDDPSFSWRVGEKGKTLLLKAILASGDTPTLLYFNPPFVEFWGVQYGSVKNSVQGQQIVRQFLERMVAMLPGSSIKEFQKSVDLRVNGDRVRIKLLRYRDDQLREAVGEFVRLANDLRETE